MAIDPRQLRPSELVRLLNSTPLGEVIGERQLLRHRSRAGFRIGDDRHVDLFRYVAWLVALTPDFERRSSNLNFQYGNFGLSPPHDSSSRKINDSRLQSER